MTNTSFRMLSDDNNIEKISISNFGLLKLITQR